MTTVYWYFVVFVSPVILVMVCAYLVWVAIKESRDADAEAPDWDVSPQGAADDEAEPPEWRSDPDAWKEDD